MVDFRRPSHILSYCILRGQIKGYITAIMCEVGSYRTVVG